MLSSPYHLPQWRKYNISKLWWPPDIPRPSCQNLLLSQACSLRNDTGALGSQWMFGTRDRSTYILLFPIEDAQTVPALKTDGPLTADDDFFPTELRNKIKIHKVVSRDPRDWYLKEMKVVTQGGEESRDPGTEQSPRKYSVLLFFETPKYHGGNPRACDESFTACLRILGCILCNNHLSI
jgi:hypothetical protein